MEEKLEKKRGNLVGERSQYVLTFVVIASMLYVAKFPILVIFFFGIFAYLLWKAFAKPNGQGTKEIFDFYISANEILRDDERRWFGFEVQEVIGQGEKIVQNMNGAPPLVFFALGALYNKSGDHRSAVAHLEYVLDDERSEESTYLHPSRELRRYVRILRKIEREPVEAPQVSAAVRSLERKRKNRINEMFEESVNKLDAAAEDNQLEGQETTSEDENQVNVVFQATLREAEREVTPKRREPESEGDENRRKPISEVLHDIYDKNVQ